jgi:hypothetical protein
LSDTPKFVPTSDDLRDALAIRLLDVAENGGEVLKDQEGNTLFDRNGMPVRAPIPASYATAITQYLKTFPPVSVPTKQSPTGVLAKHSKVLPFAKKESNGA